MRAAKLRISHLPLARWFPANDSVATSIARLCVLREDLYLELEGIDEDPIATLDACSRAWRTTYFFRNITRTLLEIRSAVERLKMEQSFLLDLSRQPRPLSEALTDLTSSLIRAHGHIKRLRNDLAGHLQHSAIEGALHQLTPDTKGLFQIGNTWQDMHYKFALEFISAAMLRHVEFQEAEQEWRKILQATLEAGYSAIPAIDSLFFAYVQIRNLSI
ncbi:MAG: hypothetical protein U0172_05360 [Nitrospiraceae bacterium]